MMKQNENDEFGEILDFYFPKENIEDLSIKRHEQANDLCNLMNSLANMIDEEDDWMYDESCNQIHITKSIPLTDTELIYWTKKLKNSYLIILILGLISYILLSVKIGVLNGLKDQITLLLCSILFGQSSFALYRYKEMKSKFKKG